MVRPTAPAPVRTPATRDQADAYRFGVRRMEAALVRGDTTLLHEQLRSQRRAAFAGVLLALLVLGGVAAHGRITSATDWTTETLVVAEAAGTMYAVVPRPPRLVPVANLAAGRLVLAAFHVEAARTAVPEEVADDRLDGAQRTAVAAVPGASGVRPDGPGPAGGWAVCDTVEGSTLTGTTVVAGVVPDGLPGTGVGVLVESAGRTWAIVDDRRHRVDPEDRSVLDALGADRRTARPVGAALLASLPEGPELTSSRGRSGDRPPPPARWADAVSEPVLCRVTTPEDPAHPRVVVTRAVPVPEGAVTVELAQADREGPRADAVVLGTGAGGAVRLTSDPARLALVSTTGVLHLIADAETAEALGVGEAAAAPDWALRLLPAGPGLDLDAARRTVDVLDRVG